MKCNDKYIFTKSQLRTIALSIGFSVAFVSIGHTAPISMEGPEVILQTPANGPFAGDQPISPPSPPSTSSVVSSASITSSTSTITVRYASPDTPLSCTGLVIDWNAQAQEAFSFAADIWATLIHSTQPIVIDACWTSLASNILGSANTSYTGNWDTTTVPKINTFYPRSLADSLAKVELHPGAQDMRLSFNQNFNWYYGTDGNPPPLQYDFVTVILHEIGHGLGFSGGADVSGAGLGSVLLGGFAPTIYSHLTKDGLGTPLLAYPQNSIPLGDALTGKVGGGVFFHGSSAIAANGGNPVALYSPALWNGGSSYSHLDEVFNGSPSDLMTFSVGPGNALHTPGPVAMALLKDLGWPTDNDLAMDKSLGAFSYDASQNNLPFDARGTLSIDFNFENIGSENFSNFYLLVNTANTATLNNATPPLINNGGVGSILSVSNALLPGGDALFNTGETLTVPLDIDIAAGGAWALNFDVLATDEIEARSGNTQPVKVSSFTLNSSMFEADGLEIAANDPIAESAFTTEEDMLTTGGCTLRSSAGRSGRIDPILLLLIAVAVFGLAKRRRFNSKTIE